MLTTKSVLLILITCVIVHFTTIVHAQNLEEAETRSGNEEENSKWWNVDEVAKYSEQIFAIYEVRTMKDLNEYFETVERSDAAAVAKDVLFKL